MKLLPFIICIFFSEILMSQPDNGLKKRFDTYLNFNGSLTSLVKFSDGSVSIMNAGEKEITIYTDEQKVLAQLLLNMNPNDFLPIYNWKKNKHLTKKQLDSLGFIYNLIDRSSLNSLRGKKIAIDPGHFAGTMETAKVEQKFIEFIPTPVNGLKDTIRFNEGKLTYQTAEILKNKLEEEGAIVMITRPQQNYTSFQISYDEWFLKRKTIILDSLLKEKIIDEKKYYNLIKLPKEKLFWQFFRDYELMERAKIINQFKPDATVIIHYNVDEKNKDWINPTTKNYTMTFIGGGMTADNFSKKINKVHFLRLLLTDQINQSEKLSSLTVNEFNSNMSITIAQKNDAEYLKESCIKSPSNGVFCRNLALCRTINSTLVYGECLYQDNIKECVKLSTNDYEIYNQKVPKRIYEAADCYFNALKLFFNKP